MSKSKILTISSDPAMLRLLQQNLSDNDYQITNAQHTKEKLSTVLEEEHPDLIILDIMMPGQDGIKVCLYIRQLSSAPIIMLSTWEAGESKVRGLDLNSNNYLTEPFGIDVLNAWIKELLQPSSVAMTSNKVSV